MARVKRSISRSLFEVPVFVALLMCALSPEAPSEAQARGRGGGRNLARGSVHGANVSRDANRNTNVNRNVNVNQNVNVNRNVNVHGGGYYGGPCCGYDRWGHPVATAVAVTATAVAVGTIVASLPPQCTATVVGNVTYQNCGGTYYQPIYQGNTVQYVVVNRP